MTPITVADRELARVFADILNRRQHLGKRWVAVLDLERAAASSSCSTHLSTDGGQT